MMSLPNPLSELLSAGLMRVEMCPIGHKALVDLDEWSKDPCNQSLLFSAAVWNSIGQALQDMDLVKDMANKGDLMKLVNPLAIEEETTQYSAIWQKLKEVNQYTQEHSVTEAMSFGMELDLTDKKAAVFMFLPYWPGEEKFGRVNVFETIIIDMESIEAIHMEVLPTPIGQTLPVVSIHYP